MPRHNLQSNLKYLIEQAAVLEDAKRCVALDSEDMTKKDRIEKKDIISDEDLQKWRRKAESLITTANSLKDKIESNGKKKCFFGLCLNPMYPYELSKEAEQHCREIVKHWQHICGFKNVQFPHQQEEAVDGFENFESRKDVLNNIIKALQRPSSNTVGVYGEDGIGKTMLVREIKRRAEEAKLFDLVVMATVRKNPDLPRIRDEIACALGLDRGSRGALNHEKSRPTEKKVLIILDDVWEPEMYSKLRERLPLLDEKEDSLSPNKILLTSKDQAVLSDLSEEQFEIHPLNENEELELFKKMAIDRDDTIPWPFYEEEIAKKCNKLPIAVITLAKAMKNRNPVKWKATYRKLQSYSHDQFLHSTLELSYGLKSKELQQTFLLCCLMGHNAATEDLLKYVIGLGLYQRVHSTEETRLKVLESVSELRKSSLLLDSGSDIHFDMHGLVRDFAVSSIALREQGLNTWSAMESIKWIYLSNCYGNDQLPDKLNCPTLTFFHLSQEDPSKPIPPNIFSEMGELRVLGLTKIWSMPVSISCLTKLNTLCLDQSVFEVEEIGKIIGWLENLKVLSLVGCNIEELPPQLGRLSNLELLDLSDCTKLKGIQSNVLSNLKSLKELYIRNSFEQWAEKGVPEQKTENASLDELMNLSLTAIEARINICNIHTLSSFWFIKNLQRYKIFDGDMWHSWDSSCGSSKLLKLKLDAKISSNHSVKELLKKTEELHLQSLSGVNNVLNELDEEGFQELKYLLIQDAQNVQHIINSMKHDAQNIDQDGINTRTAFPKLEVLVLHNLEKMEKICHGLVRESSFSNLRMITVEFCNQLKNLFSSSLAKRNLLQLQEIRVTKCSNMEEIVGDDEQGGQKDILKELRSVRLEDLPKLIAFNCSGQRTTLFEEQVFSAGKLMKLIIKGCDNLKCIFSSSMARGLNMLKHLEIRKCKSMKEVIFTDNNADEKMIFPQLDILQIEDLEDLVNFYSGNYIEFQSLKKLQVMNCPKLEGFIANTQTLFNEQVKFTNLEFLRLSSINIKQIWDMSSEQIASVKILKNLFVEGCGNLEYLLTSSMAKSFKQLIMLKISNCKMIKGVIKEEERMCEVSFPELDTLELEDLPKLTRFYLGNSNATISECLPAASIDNVENNYMPSLFHEKVEFPKLRLLRLSSINIQQIWDLSIPKIHSAVQNSKISLPVQNLKKLFVEGCGKVKYLLTSSMVMSFNQLIWLKICDCEMMEAVIDSDKSMEEEISFPKLHTLELIKLPKLTRFYHAKFTDMPFLFDEKVKFPKLKFLSLSLIDIQQIWPISIPKVSLEKLSVKDCGNLKYLLMSSMVKSFEQLMVLKICDCKMMEQVIISSELVEEEMMCESFFSKVDTLELEDLPKLATLCQGNYSKFKFSKLRQFTISKCAALKMLIGDNIAASTENVENTYTPSLFDEKVEFPILERVIIKSMGSWYKIWDDKHDVNSCCQLNSLIVDSCQKLLNIFPFSMLERVRQKLNRLEIQNCDSLEEIFGASQPQAQITTQPTNLVEIAQMFLFPELTHINLSELPKLKGFAPQIHINEWPSLKQLQVHECDEVQIFATVLPSFLEINGDDKLQIQWISKRILLYKRDGKICYMLPARHLVIWRGNEPDCWRWFKPDPRFPEVAEILGHYWFKIHAKSNTRMLSPKTRYKAYLVFKLADEAFGVRNEPIEATLLLGVAEVSKRKVYVQAEGGIVGYGDQYPKERGDNWSEVELGEIEFTKERGGDLKIHLEEINFSDKRGVIVQGMEIRPN